MWNKKWDCGMCFSKHIILVLIVLLGISFTASAEDITGPKSIESQGLYRVVNDISCPASGTCIDVNADNVVIDGRNHVLQAQDSNWYNYGINLHGHKNIQIKNIKISGFSNDVDRAAGLVIGGGNSVDLQNVTLSENSFGLQVGWYGSNQLLRDSIITNNTYGIDLDGFLEVYNSTISLNNQGIVIDNFHGDNKAKINKNIFSHNSIDGIYLSSNDGHTIFENIFEGNGNGISISSLNGDNPIYNNTFISNSEAFLITDSTLMNISHNIITVSDDAGIYLGSSSKGNIVSNKIVGNTNGVVVLNSNDNNLTDNYFNNPQNVHFASLRTSNSWNSSKSIGPNIVEGPFIGGNYWANPSGDGYSQKCTDNDEDGFCDEPYTLTANNTDKLPLKSSNTQYHVISASAGPGGSISPSGFLSFAHGSSVTFTITPDSDFLISNVLVDGISVGKVTSYPFTNITDSHTIKASFIQKTPFTFYPSSVANTENAQIQIFGEDISNVNQVSLNKDGSVFDARTILTYSDNALLSLFNLASAPLGTYNLTLAWKNGSIFTFPTGLNVTTRPDGMLTDPIHLNVTAGKTELVNVSVSGIPNFYVTLQKTVHSGDQHYNWKGTVRVLNTGGSVLKEDTGNQDQIIHLQNLSAGLYTIEVSSNEKGSGILKAYDTLPQLPVGEWIVDTVLRPYGSVYYQVFVPENQDVLRLDAQAIGSNSNFRVYHGYWGSKKTWIGKGGPNAYLKIADPDPGLYVLSFQDTQMVTGEDQKREVMLKANFSSSSSPVTMWPYISSFTPITGGTAGNVTMTIQGGSLKDCPNVNLTGSGEVTIRAGSVLPNSDGSLSAVFDLSSQSPGTYILSVSNPDKAGYTATSTVPFTIENGGKGGFYAELSGRENIRYGYPATFIVTYGNNGTVDMPAQLVSIGTNPLSKDVSARFLPDGEWQKMDQPMTMICSGGGENYAILPAGSEYKQEISVKSNSWDQFSLFLVPYSDSGLYTPQTLESITDVLVSGPGMALSIGRSYGAGPLKYYGPFGYGWVHSYDMKLERLGDGNVGLQQGDSFADILVKQSDGSYKSLYGYPVLKFNTDGSSVLTGKDGSRASFGSDFLLKSMTDTAGNSLTLEYQGTKISGIVHSDGDKITVGYDTSGKITSLTDPYGKQTTFSYTDTLLSSVTNPDGTTSYAYSEKDGGYELSKITYPGGIEVHYNTDSSGRISHITSNDGREPVIYAYNTETRETTTTDATGSSVSIVTNEDGNIVRMSDQVPSTALFTYAGKYDLTSYTDPSGKVYSTMHDSSHNPVTLTDALGSVTRISYDSRFNIPSLVTDARGNSIRMVYDEKGNLRNMTYPDGSQESHEYNNRGMPVDTTIRSGQKIGYEYDSHGQVTKIIYPDGTTFGYQYDKGNLVKATGPDGDISLNYDAADRLTKITYPDGKWISYSYNSAGQVTRKELSDGFITGYEYDTIGNLISVTDGSGTNQATYSYDAAGKLIRTVLHSGVYTTYSYDMGGRMTSLINTAQNGSVLSKFLYQYDKNGNPINITTKEGTTRYGYDGINQLTNVTYPDGSTESYSYDAVGNRIISSKDGVSTSYVTNSMNQYTSAGDQSFTYDRNGNLISKTEGGKTTTYEYRADNRITKVFGSDGIWEYSYDALGNRNKVVHDGVTELYLIDPSGLGNIVSTSTGNQTTHYRYGIGLLSLHDQNGFCYEYLFDRSGHTSQIVNNTGNIVNEYRYTPFGQYLENSENISNHFTYAGLYGVLEDKNGLYYMRMREYDPLLGRYISEDRVLNLKNHFYQYALNNPIRFFDPLGLWTFQFGFNGNLNGLLEGGAISQGVILSYSEKYGFQLGSYSTFSAGLIIGLPSYSIGFETTYSGNPSIWDAHGEGVEGVLGIEAAIYSGTLSLSVPVDQNLNPNGATPFYTLSAKIGSPKIADMFVGAFHTETIVKPLFSINIIGPKDPEDKFGPSGYDQPNTSESNLHRYIPGSVQTLPYRVDIWNAANATANVRDIDVYDEITQNLNRNSFGFTEVGFMDWIVPLDGVPSFLVYVDTRPTMNLTVKIEGMYNPSTGMVNLTYNTLDPVTLLPPEDPLIGFLPPITDSGKEITWFAYTTETKPNLPTGTRIENRAWVQFDGFGAYNPAPPNQTYVNTIDASKPVSNLTASVNGNIITVQLSGSDAGSGITSYTVFASMDNGEYYPAVSDVMSNTASFPGSKGKTYRLYSQATDNVGNVEEPHSFPDATVVIPDAVSPGITRISPTSAPAESPAVNLTVYGSGYSPSGTIRADGTSLTTQYISESELHGVVPSELLTTPRTISIDVMNSDSGMSSNAMLFTVTSNRTWIITATSSPNGTITPSGLVEVSEGGEKTFTMTPNTGYAVKDVLVDGDSTGPASTYTFTNVVSNRTIHAEFANLSGQHAINARADDWTINYPSGQKIYPTGTNQTQITQAKPGADLSDVKVDNTSQGSVPSYTFTNINTSHEISTEGDATPGQVHVRFDGSPVSGKAPVIVQFEDKSLGDPSSWYWNFGDGTNSTDQHPDHIYRYPGSYTVSLRAHNNETGGNLLKNSYITVLE